MALLKHKPISAETNRLAGKVVSAAYLVHHELGPGLLESIYETCVAHVLKSAGLKVERQVAMPVRFQSVVLETGFRIDLMVADQLIVELKTVDALLPVHKAQLITYLKLSGCRLGLLINFNVEVLKKGLQRVAL